MTMLFWNVGKRINEDILQNKRAEYGKRIVPTLLAQLETTYGKDFTLKNIRRMMKFAEEFPDLEIGGVSKGSSPVIVRAQPEAIQ
jgi:hypothetical protein